MQRIAATLHTNPDAARADLLQLAEGLPLAAEKMRGAGDVTRQVLNNIGGPNHALKY